ncbi:unnamed protein product [Penicillium viridicatum]
MSYPQQPPPQGYPQPAYGGYQQPPGPGYDQYGGQPGYAQQPGYAAQGPYGPPPGQMQYNNPPQGNPQGGQDQKSDKGCLMVWPRCAVASCARRVVNAAWIAAKCAAKFYDQ